MEEIIHYLELKNQYYEKFHSMTSKFLVQARQNKWDDLDLFADNRERILNIIRSYDFKIAKIFERLDIQSRDMECYRSRVKNLLDLRTEWATKIVDLDLDLISRVEEMKSETIRELKKSVEKDQQIGTFAGAPVFRKLPKISKDV